MDPAPKSIDGRCLFLLLLLLLAPGCALVAPAPTPPLQRIDAAHYPALADDMAFDGLAAAIDNSLIYLRRQPSERRFCFGGDCYPTAHMIRSLEIFRDFAESRPSGRAVQAFVEKRYLLYRSTGANTSGTMLFSGYYEPLLKGSRTPGPDYPFALYGRPRDLVRIELSRFSPRFTGENALVGRITAERRVVPYFTRREIVAENRLAETAAPLVWVDDRIERFFLEIQGSGRVLLPDGGPLTLQYCDKNGHPYRSIGRLLIEQGKIPRDQMSMQRIKAYLRAHPDEVDDILAHNPSFVFFRLSQEQPRGSLGVPVTPGRSLALDRKLFPPAALAFFETRKPLAGSGGKIARWVPLRRFGLNQDTGGAIRGSGRADLFWGNGAYAELAAGHMRHTGELYLMVLNPGEP